MHKDKSVQIIANFGLEIVYHRHHNVYVALTNHTYIGRIRGLCGNYNGNPNDDFTTRQNQHTGDQIVFADSWKISNTCPKPQHPGPSPCAHDVELKNFAEVKIQSVSRSFWIVLLLL